MARTPFTNFGKVTVSTTYGDADAAITLNTGHGSRLPSTYPYPLVWWDATTYGDPADDPKREIVSVWNRTGDIVSVDRGVEGTAASTKNTAGKTYKMALCVTKAVIEELQSRGLSQSHRGLSLYTGTSSPYASRVYFDADSIVMSDGEEVTGWNDIFANITVSGAGGLDTGTEQNSTWYEVYALWNGSLKKACLHRAKDITQNQDTSASITEDATQGLKSSTSNDQIGQGFKVSASGTIDSIDVKLNVTGSPTGYLLATIYTDDSGKPSATSLGASHTQLVTSLPSAATWIRFKMVDPVTVSSGTQYHVVLSASYTVSGSNYVGWRMDGSAAGYTNGSKSLYSSLTTLWTADTDDDMMLRVNIIQHDTDFSTTVPSGYTYAFLGYCYNDSSGNIVPFHQVGTSWRYTFPNGDGLVVNETSSSVELISLLGMIPPRDVIECTFSLTGTGAATAEAVLSSIWNASLSLSSNGYFQLGIQTTNTGELMRTSGSLAVLGQGVMMIATSGADLYLLGFRW